MRSMRSVFWWLRCPCVPASTVASYAMTTARTPQPARSGSSAPALIVAMPVTMPSAGVLRRRLSTLRRLLCAATASAPYWTKLPAALRSATFSRAVRRPWPWRFATASGRDASSV